MPSCSRPTWILETLVRTIDRFLMFYIRTADRLQRTAPWIEALSASGGGLDQLRAVVMDDKLGICAELDAAMAEHVTNYADEWRGVLDDPAKLARIHLVHQRAGHPGSHDRVHRPAGPAGPDRV